MKASELLTRLEALGVELTVGDEGRLRANAARGQLDDALKQAISTHKPELIDLLRGRAAVPTQLAPIPRGGGLPLSFFQERLWVLQRLEPQNTAYLIEAHWLAPAGQPAERVAAAVERVRELHEGLRVAYFEDAGLPVARVVAPSPVQCIDLSNLPPDEQRRRIDADIDLAVHTPMELAPAVPVRFSVYALQPDRALVLLAAHHIALDAWSIDVFRGELAAELEGTAGPPATRDLHYADFAAWQRASLDQATISAELDWWAATLKDAPQVSAFPADRSPGDADAGRSVQFEWDADFSEALRRLVREEGCTVYMALLAACAALLRRYTGQGDVVLGSPMGERDRVELERIIGPFVNVLLIRLDLSDDPGFAELLRRARNALLDAHAHRRVPLELLIERLKPARSFEHAPLFQTALVQHGATPQGELSLSGGGALHDLTWFLREREGRYCVDFEYRSDRYSAALVERLGRQLQQLLRGAIADRHLPVSRLSLLTPQDRTRLLRGFNATGRVAGITSFTAEFERQVRATPQRAAVSFEGVVIDYASLDARANQLARRLREEGAGPGVLVGICLERSVDLLVALIAVQKSGAAYLPLDPGFPGERLAYMLEDSGAKVLVTGGEVSTFLDLPPDLSVVDVKVDAVLIAALGAHGLESLGSASDAAYVIYTSGSTGRPKGVAVSHGALANFLGSMRREPGLTADDVLAAVTTISFDIAGMELYLPLIVGARIELIARETAIDGEALARQLDICGATALQATPATWRLLLEVDWRPSRPFRAFCGGESLPRELADNLLERVSELWNLYGPTETTIWSTVERVPVGHAPVRIGRPIDNTQIYVLDAAGEPVPIGVAGELWIGGQGVAIGYHRRPELTAERFVPDRFSAEPGARLYRTGDLARWDEEGSLHHLGRIDHQVKIRGFRIELGEIEAALTDLPDIRQAVVLARNVGNGDLRLVAYVVVDEGAAVTTSEIRRALKRQLPEYMIPSFVVGLQSIPLTPNGKVNRAALPDPYDGTGGVAKSIEPLRPGTETDLADIWKQVLKIEQVSAGDNFFDLGGHSLLTIRVAAKILERKGAKIDPRQLFFHSLRQMAEAIDSIA